MVNAKSVSGVGFMDLSDEEKLQVINLAKKKENEAERERIIRSYERMALSVAKKHGGMYGNADMNEIDEIIQAGRIGTMEAIRAFRGGSMGAFTNCVKYNMWSKLNERKGEGDITGCSAARRKEIDRVNSVMGMFSCCKSEEEKIARTADFLGTDVETVRKVLSSDVSCSSIVFENDDGEEVYVTDLIAGQENPVEDSYVESEMCRTLELAMNGCLTSLERRVVKMHNGIDCEKSSFSKIGEAFGISKQRAQQINVQAEGKIRSCSMSEQLRSFVA